MPLQSRSPQILELTHQLYTKSLGCCPGNLLIWMPQLAVALIYVACCVRCDKCSLFLYLTGIDTISTLLTQQSLVLMRLSNMIVSPSGYVYQLDVVVCST